MMLIRNDKVGMAAGRVGWDDNGDGGGKGRSRNRV